MTLLANGRLIGTVHQVVFDLQLQSPDEEHHLDEKAAMAQLGRGAAEWSSLAALALLCWLHQARSAKAIIWPPVQTGEGTDDTLAISPGAIA